MRRKLEEGYSADFGVAKILKSVLGIGQAGDTLLVADIITVSFVFNNLVDFSPIVDHCPLFSST